MLQSAQRSKYCEKGCHVPLEFLKYKIEHGIVDAGFRGEFVTKVLLYMAMEDVQQHLVSRKRMIVRCSTRLNYSLPGLSYNMAHEHPLVFIHTTVNPGADRGNNGDKPPQACDHFSKFVIKPVNYLH